MITRSPPNQRQAPEHYNRTLRCILSCIPFRLKYDVIAKVLNREGISTATGLQFSATAVASLMCRLRRGTGYYAHALAAGVVAGTFTLREYHALAGKNTY